MPQGMPQGQVTDIYRLDMKIEEGKPEQKKIMGNKDVKRDVIMYGMVDQPNEEIMKSQPGRLSFTFEKQE